MSDKMKNKACNPVKKNNGGNGWKFNRKINISVLVQLVFLAALILGTWVNLQRQLCLLEHNVGRLLENQKRFQEKLQELSEADVEFEYRLRAMENENEQEIVY